MFCGKLRNWRVARGGPLRNGPKAGASGLERNFLFCAAASLLERKRAVL
jgi:hypothetical protein